MKNNYKLLTRSVLTMAIVAWGFVIEAQCTISGLNANYCTNSAVSTLTPGTPGGTFSGPGISGSVFNPSVAGSGTHTITYQICSATYSVGLGSFSPSTTVGNTVSLSDDQVSGALPIGFSFNFFCNTYTNFYISSNGFITFSAGAPNGCCAGGSMPTFGTPNNMIAVAWTDLHPPSAGSITYSTVGTAPNRKLLVSYNGINHYNSGSYCCPITTQIQLHETTNIIEIHTTTKPLPINSYNTTMGIQNLGGSVAYPVSGRNANNNWTATNECYRWTPGVSCSATQTTIVSPSTISVVGNPSICVGQSSSLTANGNSTYTWTQAGNLISNAPSVVLTPTSSTTYSVAGTNSFGCVAGSAITVTVDNTPTVTANTSAVGGGVCPNSTLTLFGGGATAYVWTGGVSNNVPFQAGNTSNFTVTGTNACGSATAAITVSIHPLPPVTASASQPTVCSGVSVTVVGGGASTYTWSPSNISNGVAFFPTVTQSYSVIGTSALGCTASAVTSISVTTTPILAPIATPTRICVGETATITASGAASYSWSPGNQNTSAITVTPGTTSTYTLLKWNDNCFDTKTITVLVDPLPTVLAFASPSTICLYNTTTLQAGGGTSYTWSPQGGQGPNSFTTIVSPQVSTNYTVTAFDGSCTSTGTVDVIVNQNPTITVSASSTVICQGDPVNLTVSGASNYQWSNNLGTASSVTDYPSGPTLYTVSGTNASNCTAVVSQIVLVNPLPVITTTVTRPLVCEGGTSTLSAGGAATYSWNAGTNNTGPVTVVNTNVNTVYTVTGSYTTGCINTKTVLVSVFEPTFAVSSNTAVCFGGSVTLVASAANSYTWINGPQGPTYMVSPPAKTVYTVIATSNSGSVNCTSTNTVEVDIYLNPTVTAVPTRTSICRYESVDLNANGAVNYSWNNNMNGATITVSPFSTTNYTVTGTDQFGCKNTGTVQVRVQTCVGIDENVAGKTLSIYPNPNNGEFTIETESAIHLVLVNELGQLIRNFDLDEKNHYKANVKELANGVYFISGENENYKVHQKIVVSK